MSFPLSQLRNALSARQPAGSIVYFPQFANPKVLNDHYHRAAWYLPQAPGSLDRVVMGSIGPMGPAARPGHMGGSRRPVSHISITDSTDDYVAALANARIVLTWSPVADSPVIPLLKAHGVRCINVDTTDESAAEYGAYCGVAWRMLEQADRLRLMDKSHQAYMRFVADVRAKDYKAAAVFGTGPSVDNAFNFDFSKCYTHVCNSIVQNEELLNHIKPDMISAGDVVSHFGVSKYAQTFRNDLAKYLKTGSGYLLTTAQFGYLLTLQHPEIASRVLLCSQGPSLPNYNLVHQWWLPALDSVLNIHMLPSASTLFDTTYILGCDGKDPDPEKNEDFWPHSKLAQYHDLVETGLKSHPTFDVNRQKSTWTRFQNSVKASLEIGERRFGKRFITLAPSFTPGLAERYDKDATPPT